MNILITKRFLMNSKKAIAVFDLDDVLIHENFEPPLLCEETIPVLNYLKQKNILVVLATHNVQAKQIIDVLSLGAYFDEILAFEDDSRKVSHIQQIIARWGSDLVFYDDLEENIDAVSQLNVKTVHVDFICGIRLEQVIANH